MIEKEINSLINDFCASISVKKRDSIIDYNQIIILEFDKKEQSDLLSLEFHKEQWDKVFKTLDLYNLLENNVIGGFSNMIMISHLMNIIKLLKNNILNLDSALEDMAHIFEDLNKVKEIEAEILIDFIHLGFFIPVHVIEDNYNLEFYKYSSSNLARIEYHLSKNEENKINYNYKKLENNLNNNLKINENLSKKIKV